MNRKWLGAASAAVLTAAALAWGGATAFAQDAPSAAAAPKYGAWGFDVAGMDRSAKPGDDFFRYANGTYQDKLVIPADKSAYSPRAEAAELTEKRIHQILEDAAAKGSATPSDDEGKIGAFYAAFMDEARVEALGAKPIAPELAAIRKASKTQLAALMGHSNAGFYDSLFSLTIGTDPKNPDRYAVNLSQNGLGLPDRDYYLDAKFAPQKAAYQAYAAKLLTLAGWPDADARAADIVAFETKVAEASWTKAQQRDPNKTYNPMSPAALARLAPQFPWAAMLAAGDLGGVKQVVVSEKSAFPKIAAVYSATPISTLRAWMAFRAADNAAPYLSKDFSAAYFELHGKTLSGQPEQPVRWKRAISAVSGANGFITGDRSGDTGTMGWAVGRAYTTRYFPAESKAKVEALVADLKVAFRARIEHLDWMAPQTKAAALKKLEVYRIKVGYPDKPHDYSRVVIRRDDLVGDVRRAAADEWRQLLAARRHPVDRGLWFMTPQTNNAYNGSLVDIVFPAAILQAPIFDPAADPAVNYGAVGGVIGHEFTHGFDDQGRQFDFKGRLHDWWAPSDSKTFDARSGVLGAQYSSYEPLPGSRVNGKLTMGENLADLGGVNLGLDAYRNSLHGRPAPVLDGFTGDQRVFLGWAQAWRGKLRDDAVRRQVVSDPHSPRQYRVNGPVRNVDAWYEAFGVQAGEKLYLKPEERVRIW